MNVAAQQKNNFTMIGEGKVSGNGKQMVLDVME
jgi:hypothetical protein